MRLNDRQPPTAPPSALADTLMDRLTAAYTAAADPGQAGPMAAYMKDVAPFLGIRTPLRRALSRAVTKDTPRPTETDCTALALRCWGLAEREYQYFAVDYLRRHVPRCSSGFLPVVRHLIVTVPWWDTVDLLAAHRPALRVLPPTGRPPGLLHPQGHRMVAARVREDGPARRPRLRHRGTGPPLTAVGARGPQEPPVVNLQW